jgi:hypothetical protein
LLTWKWILVLVGLFLGALLYGISYGISSPP